jgi:hypothetical protein
MTMLDADAIFAKLDKLRSRMDRLEQTPDANEWQYTRLLIRALTEDIVKAKKLAAPADRKVRIDAPEAVHGDWRELVDALSTKGIKPERASRS